MIQAVPLRTLWLMGAKTRIIPDFIAGAVQDLCEPGGTLLDLCAGTAIVGRSLADRYRVVANDVQEFSAVIAGAHLEGDAAWADALEVLDPEQDLSSAQERNRTQLDALVGAAIQEERRLLAAVLRVGAMGGTDAAAAAGGTDSALGAYRQFLTETPSLGSQGLERDNPGRDDPGSDNPGATAGWPPGGLLDERRRDPRCMPYALVTVYYQNVYFGLEQAVVLDSLRAAIDQLPAQDPFRDGKRRLYLAALLYAASVSTSGTSHFAQPRSVRKDSELLAVARRRSIDIEFEFHRALDAIRREWGERPRAFQHRVTCCPAETLLAEDGPLAAESIDVVYLDPPYTADNYSRFYHVLETLVRYDYPAVEERHGAPTRGLYPVKSARFASDFCRRERVEQAFRSVAERVARRGARLLVSYSDESGLLLEHWRRGGDPSPRARFARLFRDYFGHVEVRDRRLMHSGQGDKNRTIQELLVLCEHT